MRRDNNAREEGKSHRQGNATRDKWRMMQKGDHAGKRRITISGCHFMLHAPKIGLVYMCLQVWSLKQLQRRRPFTIWVTKYSRLIIMMWFVKRRRQQAGGHHDARK
jgi:hypothetical protein